MGPLLFALAALAAAYAYGRQAAHMAEKGLDVFGDPLLKGPMGLPAKPLADKTAESEVHIETSDAAAAELARLRAENAALMADRDAKVRDREAASALVATLNEQLRVANLAGDTRAADIQRQLDEARRDFAARMEAANAAKEALVANANASARAAEERATANAALQQRRGALTVEARTLTDSIESLTAQIVALANERLGLAQSLPGYADLVGFRITGADHSGTESTNVRGEVMLSGTAPANAVAMARTNATFEGRAEPYPDVRIVSDPVWRSMMRMGEITEDLRRLTTTRAANQQLLDGKKAELATINTTLSGNAGGLVPGVRLMLKNITIQKS